MLKGSRIICFSFGYNCILWLYIIIAITRSLLKWDPSVLNEPGIVKNGKETIFDMYKFRTMTDARDENGELLPDEKRLRLLALG